MNIGRLRRRAFYWTWDMVFNGNRAKTQVNEHWNIWLVRQATYSGWRHIAVGRAICRVRGHDWGWARESQTGLVMLSRQSCGRCWTMRDTPLHSQRARVFIHDDEKAKEEAILIAMGVRDPQNAQNSPLPTERGDE